MKKTHYLTATVPEGNRLDRQAFLQLPIEERRRILAEQAEALQSCYREDPDWKDWVDFDNGENDLKSDLENE
ncbi:hypothetical protein V0288_20400 [Pannus brasiliensis CCIBt3594]|uniref:Uncharacterized protein n=1 Tax=Pannus brasiliensis CCIBt3594 TaxID=1427578 RepID=A0AAW9QNY5_9CHRO